MEAEPVYGKSNAKAIEFDSASLLHLMDEYCILIISGDLSGAQRNSIIDLRAQIAEALKEFKQ